MTNQSNNPVKVIRSNNDFDVDAWDHLTIQDLYTGNDNAEIEELIDTAELIVTIHPDHGWGMDEAVYLYTRYTTNGVASGSKNLVAVWIEECGVVNLLHPIDFLKFYPNLPAELVMKIYAFGRYSL